MSTSADRATSGRRHHYFAIDGRDVMIVAALVFVAALIGSLSRPTGFLAAFWPANAVLAGVLVRSPRLRTAPVLGGAAAGYVAAALVVGDALGLTVLLTAANLVGAIVMTLLFGALPEEDRSLLRPQGVIGLLLIAAAASAVAAMVGAVALWEITGQTYLDAWTAWFAAELVNYLAILPVMLTLPPPAHWCGPWRLRAGTLRRVAPPVLALGVSIVLSLVVPHGTAVVFPVPALIWCALTLPIAATAVLVLAYSGLSMLAIKLGLFDLGISTAGLSGGDITAVHLAVALVALGPVVVASVNAERHRRLEQLERLAHHDSLTDALTRSAFMAAAELLLARLRAEGSDAALVVLDADHFKAINDEHGHPSGDRVLVALAAAIQGTIRQDDLFGRIGGEEFALLLPGATRREAEAVATRIRKAVSMLAVVLESGRVQQVTVSVGVVHAGGARPGLSELVSAADRAMYEAKHTGRNRVVLVHHPDDRPGAVP